MARMSMKPPKEPPLYRINAFKGVNFSATPTQIDENQSPDMLNMVLDERGALNKRTGYERVFETSLGEGQINGLFQYRKSDGTTVFLVTHGTTLYTQNGNNQPVSIYTGLANHRVHFFMMNGKCFIQDGANFLVYDGTTVSKVEDTAYIPTLTLSRTPSGGGEPYEDFNLMGKGFKDSFSADGTATKYVLSLKGLDATSVKAEVNGTTINEGSGLTVNRSTGEVTFSTAPAKGTNNVIITAYKTQSTFPNRIKKCQFNSLFGGSNDTRVFVAGNPDERNTIWSSGLDDKGQPDPTYWPENGFYKPGSDSEAVQGFSKQYDYLVIEKEFSRWNMSFQIVEGRVTFPMKPINEQVGTVARESIQIIENNPVSLDRKGLYAIVATQIKDERNIRHLSADVDPRLLSEPNLDKAISTDFDKKYWLAVNGRVYVFDYQIQQWYVFDNIHASCFLVMDNYLYFGSDSEGLVYRFKKLSDSLPYNDDNQPIQAYWYSKLIDFKMPERNKLIQRIFYTLKPDSHTSCYVSLRTNQKAETQVYEVRLDQFDFRNFDFSRFTFVSSDIPQEVAVRTKEKRVTHFQVKFENNEIDESLGIISLGLKYQIQSEVK